jgi:hypothetical protein
MATRHATYGTSCDSSVTKLVLARLTGLCVALRGSAREPSDSTRVDCVERVSHVDITGCPHLFAGSILLYTKGHSEGIGTSSGI